MSPAVRRAYDEATVILLRATSDPVALRRADDDAHAGLPAYDAPGRLRWDHRVCAFSGCRTPFVAPYHWQIHCSRRCTAAAAAEAFAARAGISRRAGRRAAALAIVAARRDQEAS